MSSAEFHAVALSRAGSVMEPVLHDGQLHGLDLSGDVVALRVQAADGAQVEVRCMQVVSAAFHDVRQGNLLLDLLVMPLAEADPSDLGLLVRRTPTADSSRDALLAELLGTRVPDGLVLVRIVPSYGCDGAVLCKDVRWRTVS